MKKRAFVLMAACAVLFAAAPAFALPTCDNWKGDWGFKYSDNVTDNVTINDICNNEDESKPACLPQKDGSPQTYWVCVARGKRLSDNKSIQIRRISFDKSAYFYYEGTDAELAVAGQNAPSAKIVYEDECDFFTTTEVKAPIDLVSGKKAGSAACPVADNCTLQKIIPAKISKLLSIAQPIMPFVIIGSGDPAFVQGDKAAFDSDAIKPLIQLRIGKKIILAIAFVNPFALVPGDVEVTVGECVGTIEVK